MTPEEQADAVKELEERVERLRALYDQYFMGIERIEPGVMRKDVDRRLWALRHEQIRNTGIRFKFNQITARYNTYASHWQRILRQIETGTYKRDVMKAQKRFGPAPLTAAARRRFRGQETEEAPVDSTGEPDSLGAEGVPPSQGVEGADPPLAARAARGRSPSRSDDLDVDVSFDLDEDDDDGFLAPASPDQSLPAAARAALTPPTPVVRAGSSPAVGAGASPSVRAGSSPDVSGSGPPSRPGSTSNRVPASDPAPGSLRPLAPARPGSLPAPAMPGMSPSIPQSPRPPSVSPVITAPRSPQPSHRLVSPTAASRASLDDDDDELFAGLDLREAEKIPNLGERSAAQPTPRPTTSQSPRFTEPARSQDIPRIAPAPPPRPPAPSTPSAHATPAIPAASATPAPGAAIPRPGSAGVRTAPIASPASAPRPSPPVADAAGAGPARPAAPIAIPAPRPVQPPAAAPVPPPVPAPTATPATPAAAPARPARPAPAPAPAAAASASVSSSDLSDRRLREIYGQFVETKRKCQESTAAVTFDGLARNLRESAAKLTEKHAGRSIDFEVVVKDGKTILKPVVR